MCGVIVIVTENRLDGQVKIPDEFFCASLHANVRWKGMNPFFLPVMGK